MASLMENLIEILEKENSEYELLLELSTRKTTIVVAGNIEELGQITDEEQDVVSRINRLEKKRDEILHDVADVLNKDVETLKLNNLIQMLAARPKEQEKLARVRDALRETVHAVVRINEQNGELIKHSLEMVEFDLGMMQALKSGPETANYNKGAYNAGEIIGNSSRGFDAKQ